MMWILDDIYDMHELIWMILRALISSNMFFIGEMARTWCHLFFCLFDNSGSCYRLTPGETSWYTTTAQNIASNGFSLSRWSRVSGTYLWYVHSCHSSMADLASLGTIQWSNGIQWVRPSDDPELGEGGCSACDHRTGLSTGQLRGSLPKEIGVEQQRSELNKKKYDKIHLSMTGHEPMKSGGSYYTHETSNSVDSLANRGTVSFAGHWVFRMQWSL